MSLIDSPAFHLSHSSSFLRPSGNPCPTQPSHTPTPHPNNTENPTVLHRPVESTLAKRLDYSPPLSRARLCGVCSCSTISSRTCNRPTSSSSMFRCLILARLTASARIARAPIATAPAALAPTAKAPRLVHPSPVATRANATCLPNGGCSSCLALGFLTVLSFPRFPSTA